MIRMAELCRQHDSIRDEIDSAIARVMRSGVFVGGEEVEVFEREWAAFCGVKYCISCGSGTDAITLSAVAADPEQVMRIATTPVSAFGTVAGILTRAWVPTYHDTIPEFDVDRNFMLLNVHLYGRRRDVRWPNPGVKFTIHDCCQAHGIDLPSLIRGGESDRMAHAFCHSFYPTKNLGCCGDGGAVCSDDAGFADVVRALRNYGEDCLGMRYTSSIPGGWNSRLDPIQAAILRAKLPHLAAWNRRRAEIASHYCAVFFEAGVDHIPFDPARDVAHLFVVLAGERGELCTSRPKIRCELKHAGIQTAIHYPVPIPLQGATRHHVDGKFISLYPNPFLLAKTLWPAAMDQCERCFSIPCHESMTDAEVEYVVNAVAKTMGRK